MATPFSGSLWYDYPNSGILVLWLPQFRDPCGMATPIMGSRWYGYPTFGIYVVWLPHFRDIRGMCFLRWVRSRNVYRPRTGGDRRDRWRMLMKRLLLYTTTGCGGSRQLAATNPPSYRIIILPNTNPNCSATSVLFERRALLYRSHARDAVYACSRI